ncbi:hypothetical protein SLEP1_g39667 [Rubroshorea leprosula]|uniref:Uncharacterized protein n=1 Tax=Rubroshorea leprosula TaxID=152421 RepID=A0AAV5L153_9ROSI|nr:hypothetical protein SLEP1_g39667 [Rubroshorea leprosula]
MQKWDESKQWKYGFLALYIGANGLHNFIGHQSSSRIIPRCLKNLVCSLTFYPSCSSFSL